MTNQAMQYEALNRAKTSQSAANYAAILRGFMAKGLAESEIIPRENVFTYNAWKALGRQVKRGEHGVKCITVITTTDKRTGREERRPWTTTVFHVSQTEPVGTQYAERPRINSLQIVDHDATPQNEPFAGEDQPDATGENVPFAGEDEASRASGLDDAIAAHIQPPVEPEPARFVIESPFSAVPVSAPKDSASVRAMRGEQVSIMDIINELPKRETPRHVPSFDRPFRRSGFPVRQQNEVNF